MFSGEKKLNLFQQKTFLTTNMKEKILRRNMILDGICNKRMNDKYVHKFKYLLYETIIVMSCGVGDIIHNYILYIYLQVIYVQLIYIYPINICTINTNTYIYTHATNVYDNNSPNCER